MDYQEEYEVEEIVDKKTRKKKVFYYIKWKGFPSDQNTWEPEKNLKCFDLIDGFHERYKQRKAKEREQLSLKNKKNVEKILDKSVEDERVSYLVKWKGEEENSWVLHKNLNCTNLIDEYERSCDKEQSNKDFNLVKDNISGIENSALDDLKLESIVGATTVDKEVKFAVKWSNSPNINLLSLSEIRNRYPQVLIDFFLSRLIWSEEE